MSKLFSQMEAVCHRFEELSIRLNQPETAADPPLFRRLMQEYHEAEPVVQAYQALTTAQDHLAQAKALLEGEPLDPDFKEMVQQEISEKSHDVEELENSLKILLLPKDVNDGKSVIMEIRGGAGGEEAALFGAMLMRMYMRYAERHGWKTEMLEASMTELGGVKEAVFAITGENAFSRLKYESGVHRVQRIPVTESNGKRQTSTATVAVLPEAQEVDVKINPDDLRIDVYRASGHGGQYINKTDSAVRITHIPSGIVVTCQDEKSQLKNKEKAMRVLRARLYEKMQEEKDAAYASDRRAQVGTGERSERIRTYNFNEGRVTDHRIGKTIYTIDAFVDGDMDDIIDPLIYADQQEQLRALGQGELQRG